jgi:hypothetical protein
VRPFLLTCALACLLAAPASAGPGLFVGVVDDSLKWTPHSPQFATVNRDLGLQSLRVSVHWQPGQWVTTRTQITELNRALIGARNLRIVLSVTGRGNQAPHDAFSRDAFCSFVYNVMSHYPAVNDVVIWNEPNTPLFWKPQFYADGTPAASADYEALLARCWDLLHTLRPKVNVIGVSTSARGNDRTSTSPGAFIRGVGEAYRASGRQRPLLDTIAHHPYPERSSERPSARHPYSKTIAEGDYDKLLAAYSDAFHDTGQPLPGQRGVSIWYLESGFQTAVPGDLRSRYEGRETDGSAVSGDRQGDYLAEAVRLAYCQPTVGAFFNFELADERSLAGWQSGVLWSDWTRKPSYAVFKQVIGEVGQRAVDCSRFPTALR